MPWMSMWRSTSAWVWSVEEVDWKTCWIVLSIAERRRSSVSIVSGEVVRREERREKSGAGSVDEVAGEEESCLCITTMPRRPREM